MYRLIGLVHIKLLRAGQALRESRGQGTVEYVALILLVALVMAGVVAAMKGFRTGQGKELGDVIVGKIKEAVKKVQFYEARPARGGIRCLSGIGTRTDPYRPISQSGLSRACPASKTRSAWFGRRELPLPASPVDPTAGG